jgi:hypothetical protein
VAAGWEEFEVSAITITIMAPTLAAKANYDAITDHPLDLRVDNTARWFVHSFGDKKGLTPFGGGPHLRISRLVTQRG